MSIKINVAANFAGQTWRAGLQIVCVPIYIRYLGIEAYGLIGFFAILLGWLALLDLGIRPALGREMARFSGGELKIQYLRDLLRSVELIGLATALAVFTLVWMASGWLAESWFSTRTLPISTISHAVTLMGLISAVSFLESIYLSSLSGLQRQVALNLVLAGTATVRYLGGIGVLAWISPNIEVYFLWQGLSSCLSVVLLAYFVYRSLPKGQRAGRFSADSLLGVWRFAGGMMCIALLSVMLTQVDKTLLSTLLPLDRFAHYTLAATLTATLYMFVAPITTAFYPRMTQLAASKESAALAETYHRGSQFITVAIGPAALMLIVFTDRILLLWTGNPELTANVAPILRILAFGTLLHAMMWMPYHLQLAYGWTSLSIKINVVAVVLLVPSVLILVPIFGPLGSASAWVILNVGYIAIGTRLMHRRILVQHRRRWLVEDIATPLVCAGILAITLNYLTPSHLDSASSFFLILACAVIITLTAGLMAAKVRQEIFSLVMRSISRRT